MNSVLQSSRPQLPMLRGRSSVFLGLSPGLTCVVLVLVVLGFGLAPAQAADRADLHYKRALKQYESKDYPSAIKEFQAAYRVRQLPKILLNIGQVYRKLGMASTALKFYQHYLRVEPNPKAEIKAEVDRYIAQTKAMLDPPDFVAPGTQLSAADAAAADVAAAPSNVTPVTVPELYSDDDLQSLSQVQQRDAKGRPIRRLPVTTENPTALTPGTQPPVTQPPTALPLVPTPPPITDTPPVQPKKPVYKEAWFWGLVGGIAGAVIITGAAVGAQRSNTLPPDILHPTK